MLTDSNIIPLRQTDLEALGLNMSKSEPGKMSWSRNLTRDQAKQVNGFVGETEWKTSANLSWNDNVAEGNAWQVNGGMSAEEARHFFK